MAKRWAELGRFAWPGYRRKLGLDGPSPPRIRTDMAKKQSANLDNDYWLRRAAWEDSVRDMFRDDFPEFDGFKIKVCGNGVVFVYPQGTQSFPGIIRGYPPFSPDDPSPENP